MSRPPWTGLTSTGSRITSPRTPPTRSASTPSPEYGRRSSAPGARRLIPNTYEWTYEPETTNFADAPYGWCLNHGSGACAQFFGGQTNASSHALMWQWSGGGGVPNGFGDIDQIDSARLG